jgi:hypothetical protein
MSTEIKWMPTTLCRTGPIDRAALREFFSNALRTEASQRPPLSADIKQRAHWCPKADPLDAPELCGTSSGLHERRRQPRRPKQMPPRRAASASPVRGRVRRPGKRRGGDPQSDLEDEGPDHRVELGAERDGVGDEETTAESVYAERERRAYERWKASLRVHQADLFNGGPERALAQQAAAAQKCAELERHFSDPSVAQTHVCAAQTDSPRQEGPCDDIQPLVARQVTYYGLSYSCPVKVRYHEMWEQRTMHSTRILGRTAAYVLATHCA